MGKEGSFVTINFFSALIVLLCIQISKVNINLLCIKGSIYNMAERNDEDQAEVENAPTVEEEVESFSQENSADADTCTKENQMPSQQQEEEMVKKKYGGLLSKKPPLISKDNERAFFDSADWALGKKSKGPLEALRPKLQPTPHQQVRARSPCAPADASEEDDCNSSEDHNSTSDGRGIESHDHHHHEDQNVQT